jgi:hypothetical protein
MFWGMAALLALLAIAFVILNKANLGIGSVSPASHEEKRDGEWGWMR